MSPENLKGLYVVTLGKLVLDELFFASRSPIFGIIGGSGTYCMAKLPSD